MNKYPFAEPNIPKVDPKYPGSHPPPRLDFLLNDSMSVSLDFDQEVRDALDKAFSAHIRHTGNLPPIRKCVDAAKGFLDRGYSSSSVCELALYMPSLVGKEDGVIQMAYFSNEIIAGRSLALDQWVKRQNRCTPSDYLREESNGHIDDITTLHRHRMNAARKTKRDKDPSHKLNRKYKRQIEIFYDYFDQDGRLPLTTVSAFNAMLMHPNYFNAMAIVLRHLYGVVDGGYYDLHANHYAKTSIQKETWLQAIELTFAMVGENDQFVVNLDSPFENQVNADWLDELFPTIVCTGLLIHNLQLFTSQQYANQLLERRRSAVQESAVQEDPATQIQDLTQKLNAVMKENTELKKSNDSLRKQIGTGIQTDVSSLIHEHNATVKEKDQQIEDLQDIVAHLEAEIQRLTSRSHANLESGYDSVKPWANTTLPKERVIFAGGNPNLLKKLKQLYQNERENLGFESGDDSEYLILPSYHTYIEGEYD